MQEIIWNAEWQIEMRFRKYWKANSLNGNAKLPKKRQKRKRKGKNAKEKAKLPKIMQNCIILGYFRQNSIIIFSGDGEKVTNWHKNIGVTICAVLSWIGKDIVMDSIHVSNKSRVSGPDIYLVGNYRSYKLTSVEMTRVSKKKKKKKKKSQLRRAFLDREG